MDVSGVPASVSGLDFSAEVPLSEGANPLVATGTNAAGRATDRVEVVLDTTPPVVEITTPADGTLTAEAEVAVEGTATDASPLEVLTVNGAAVELVEGAFATTVPLSLGGNELEAVAVDAAGNAGSDAVSVTRGEPPTVSIEAPAEGALLAAKSVPVTGSVTGLPALEVVVNGVPATVTEGTFEVLLTLAEGANALTATATNPLGEASDGATVRVDTTPPVVTIDSPADGAELEESPVAVRGSVTDASPIASLTLNGAVLPAGTAFESPLELDEGANPIRVVATDVAGNAGESSISVSFASRPPLAIAIEAPPEGAVVSRERVAVTGTVSDPEAVVRVEGVLATVTGSRFVAPDVALDEEGENTLTATASREGESASDDVRVVLNRAPEITITSPPDGSATREASSDVEGLVDEPSAFVDVNGVSARVDSAGRFFAPDVPLEPGENRLEARAVDSNGARGRDRVTVVRDADAAPGLRIVVNEDYAPLAEDRFTTSVSRPRVAFSSPEDFRAGLERTGWTPRAFEPALAEPVARSGFRAFVLNETDEPASLQADSPTDAVTCDPDDSGGIIIQSHETLGEIRPIAELADALQNDEPVNPELFSPQDFSARYFQEFECVLRTGSGEISPEAQEPVTLGASTSQASDELGFDFDEQDPELTITSPEFDSVVASDRVSVSGTVDDAGGAVVDRVRYEVFFFEGFSTVKLDEGEAPVLDGRFTLEDLPLGEGLHNIDVTASDAAGNRAEATVSITSDLSAPVVSLVAPEDGRAVTAGSVSVDLNFSEGGTLVSVNGEPDGRSFEAGLARDVVDLPLELGANPVAVVFEAPDGRRAELDFTFFRLEERAPLEIVSPSDGSFVGEELVTVEGRVPRGTPAVEVNGVLGEIAADGASFTAEVTLDEGENTLRAVALPFGQSDSVAVTADFTLPRLRAVVPAAGTATADSALDLVAFLDEGGRVAVEGPAGRRASTTRVDRARSDPQLGLEVHRAELEGLPLELGENALTLRATDAAGNETAETLPILRREAALTLASPAEGTVLDGVRAEVVLEAVEPVTLEAWHAAGRRLASFEGAELFTGSSTFAGVPLVPGENPMRIVYRRAGGPSEVLAFTLASSADAASAGLASVQGTVTDGRTGAPLSGALVTLRVGDDAIRVATGADGRYSARIPAGTLELDVSAEGFLPRQRTASLEAGTTLVADAALTPWEVGAPSEPGTPTEGDATTLAGVATDASTGEALGGVLVQVVDAGGGAFSAISAADGSFSIPGIPSGELKVSAARVGYAPEEADFTTSGSTTAAFDPALEPLDEAPESLPSEVAIQVPPDGTVTDFEAVTVVGTVSDPAARVSVNGVNAEVVGPRFTARGVPLVAGENAIEAVASAPGAEPATAAVTVTRADEPVLDVALYSPPAGASVPGSGLVVRGFVSAKRARTLVSGGFARVEEGVFAVPDVDLPTGSTSVVAVSSLPEGGATERDEVPVEVRSTEPALTLEATPASGTPPLDVTLTARLEALQPSELARLDFDTDGDRALDLLGSDTPAVEATLAEARAYLPRAFATTPEGVEVSAAERVTVHFPPEELRSFAEGNPVDLAAAPDGGLYVLDAAAGRVSRHAPDGSLQSIFGSSGAGSGQLRSPRALAVGPEGRVFVADTGNDRVQVFGPDGTFERTIGGPGSGSGELRGPRGLAFDGETLVVSDAGNARLQLFTAEGSARATLPLADPRGLEAVSGFGWLVASPTEGLQSVTGEGPALSRQAPAALDELPTEGRPRAPVDVVLGDGGPWVADAAEGRLVGLTDRLGFRRTVPVPGAAPLAVLPSRRRALPTLYVADGERVREIGLPVPSPVPVLESLKSRLLGGDIEGALELIHPAQRPVFEGIYTDLTEEELTADAEAMEAFQVDLLRPERAIVRIEAVEYRGEQAIPRLFPVHLVRLEDGTWRIFDY